MRAACCVLALLAAGSAFEPAQADPYRWCASYNGHLSGTHCYFVSLEQCRMSVSGVGGYCVPNPRTVASEPGAVRRKPRS